MSYKSLVTLSLVNCSRLNTLQMLTYSLRLKAHESWPVATFSEQTNAIHISIQNT